MIIIVNIIGSSVIIDVEQKIRNCRLHNDVNKVYETHIGDFIVVQVI